MNMITNKEAIELSFLLQKRDRGRMRRTNYERMRELTEKMNHNACLNASCSGYQGTEIETICPKCEHKLYKKEND